ncbi:hypothetical protein AUJ14_00970 [Candidatus Micrarchaeota archaeon CG1_02_55_22]|nr:MAG: hypothetical protein AUJ14_00970 [Candidatus Micrarchaeota archaeon CG1_02_55_22]
MPESVPLDAKGGILKSRKLVWVPIGGRVYAYQVRSFRGLAYPQQEGVGDEFDDKPRKSKKPGPWFVEVCGHRIDNPTDVLTENLQMPLSFWESWERGEVPALEGCEVFRHLLAALKTFNDSPTLAGTITHAVGVLNSWAWPWLETAPRVWITSKPGAGKTAQLETITMLSRGGRLESDLSGAGFARAQQTEFISWGVDEADSLSRRSKSAEEESSPLITSLRQGYRRGASYSRANKDGSTTTIPIAGPAAYTSVMDVDTMLQGRSIKSDSVASRDSRLPVIHTAKRTWLLRLKGELYAWFMNSANLPLTPVEETEADYAALPHLDYSLETKKQRQVIFDVAVNGFSTAELAFFQRYRGRAAELAYSVATLGRVFGLTSTDYDDLRSAFDELQIELDSPPEGAPALLLETLRAKFAGQLIGFEVLQREVLAEVATRLGQPIGKKAQGGVIREAGIPVEAVRHKNAGKVIILTEPLKALLFTVENDDNDSNIRKGEQGDNQPSEVAVSSVIPSLSSLPSLPTVKVRLCRDYGGLTGGEEQELFKADASRLIAEGVAEAMD